MNTVSRVAMSAGVALTLGFSLMACHKNKEPETNPMSAGSVKLSGKAEVTEAAFHPSEVQSRVDSSASSLADCFQGQGAMDVKVTLEVSKGGEVTSAKSNARTPEIDSCVMNVFKGLRFPSSHSGKGPTVTIPLHYSP